MDSDKLLGTSSRGWAMDSDKLWGLGYGLTDKLWGLGYGL